METVPNSPQPSFAFTTGPVFIPSQPSLRIASVAGVSAPAAPTGNRDIELPETTTGPVTVDFASAGIPLGTTVTLTANPPSDRRNRDQFTASPVPWKTPRPTPA